MQRHTCGFDLSGGKNLVIASMSCSFLFFVDLALLEGNSNFVVLNIISISFGALH